MFGKNKLQRPQHGDGLTLRVVEIFKTIQGEGPYTGTPAVFVRLAGCNLACYFCDTDFESDAQVMRVDTILLNVLHSIEGIGLVVITGGEPLLQNIAPLCQELLARGLRVQIETAGTVWPTQMSALIEDALQRQHILVGEDLSFVCSPKTGTVHKEIERWCQDYKYPLRAGGAEFTTGLPVWSTQSEGKAMEAYRPPPHADIWLQPMMEYAQDGTVDEAATQANTQYCIQTAMEHGHRLSIQVHKILNLP